MKKIDYASICAVESGALGAFADPYLRMMVWGALWDQVRDAQIDPLRFARLALKEMPREKDEQLFPTLVGRLTRVVNIYASPEKRDSVLPGVERAPWTGPMDTTRPNSIRRARIHPLLPPPHPPETLPRLAGLRS